MSDEWVLVPREPTEAMFSASSFQEWDTFEQEWRAMLDAAPQQADPVAWRDHVEQRLHNWRQRTMNRSGDRLALDDMMSKESIDDLIDYVCDEWSDPVAPQQAEPVAQIGWADEFGNLYPMGAWKPTQRTHHDSHKTAWRPVFLHPPAAEAQRLREAAMAVVDAYRNIGPVTVAIEDLSRAL